MSLSPNDNPYLELGLERTADDRAVRKAYAAKLREFPPETHPEQFKKIRAAYELLADKDARARFDEAAKDFTEHPEEVGRRLTDVEAFLGEDKLDLALDVVDDLIGKFPALAVLRFRRALVLARMERWAESTEQVDWLVEREPTNVTYRLLRARLLRREDHKDRAEADLRESFRLSPDGPTRVALADLLWDRDARTEALALLDEGIRASEARSQERLEFLLAKLSLVRLGGQDGADEIVAALREVVRAAADAETARYVVGRMGETAARLFAQDRFAQGKLAMHDCEVVHPDGQAYLDIPAKASLSVRALPQAGQRWLGTCEPGPSSATIAGSGVGGLLFLLMCCFVPVAGGIYALSNPDLAVLGATALVVGLGAAALCVRAYLRRVASPLRAFTTVESPYVVRVSYDSVDVFSLLYLQSVRAVHHHTNGVYTGTQFTLTFFDEMPVSFSIRGQQYAESWLKFLGEQRRRAIELLGEGFLEANGMIDAIPPRLLRDVERSPKQEASPSDPRSLWQRVRVHATRREQAWLGVTLGLSLASVLAVLAAGTSLDAWFLNGLDVPVTIEAGGTAVALKAGERVRATVATGRHRFVVKAKDGRVLAEERVTVPRFADAVIYNALGAAPVYGVATIFRAYQSQSDERPKPTFYAGQTFIVEHSADYVMRAPPHSLSASKDSGTIVKRHVDALEGGWSTTVKVLLHEKQEERAQALLQKIVALSPDDRQAVALLIHAVEARGADVAAVLEPLLGAHPTSVALATNYVHDRVRADRPGDARAHLAADTTAGRIGRALLEPAAPALVALAALVAKEPDNGDARLWLARVAAARGDYATCVQQLSAIDKAHTDARELAQCHALAGQPALAAAVLGGGGSSPQTRAALAGDGAHFLLARGGTLAAAVAGLKAALVEEEAALAEARLRIERGEGGAAPSGVEWLTAVAAVLNHFAEGAPGLYKASLDSDVRVLPLGLEVLLVAELVRLGQRDQARRLYEREPAMIVPFDAIAAYVTSGAREDELWRVRIEALGALDFVRARALEQQGRPAAALYARAKARDPFSLWVRRAQREWPPVVER